MASEIYLELFLKSENTGIEEVDEYPDFDEYMTSSFTFAVFQGDYYKVVRGVLTNKFDIHFYQDIVLIDEYIVADSNFSIFKIIEKIYS